MAFLLVQGAGWPGVVQGRPRHVPGTLPAAEEEGNFSGCVSGEKDAEQGAASTPQKGKEKTNDLLRGGAIRLCTKR